MQIVLHAGVHETDEDRLLKCLLKNKDFAAGGVAVPAPARYRKLLRDAMHALANGEPSPKARDVLLDAILEGDTPDRMILSNHSFFGVPNMAVTRGALYPAAEKKLIEFRQLFPNDQVELFLAVRNPATFLPAVYEKSKYESFVDFTGGTDPTSLLWSEFIRRIRQALPDMPITVWCNEDTPLIWGQIIREAAGIEHNRKVIGSFDLLHEIMTKEGMKRFRAYLKQHPVMTEIQKRRVISAFLDKFAIEDAIEQELDLPGWTEELVDELSDIYDEDIFSLERIPGVHLITP